MSYYNDLPEGNQERVEGKDLTLPVDAYIRGHVYGRTHLMIRAACSAGMAFLALGLLAFGQDSAPASRYSNTQERFSVEPPAGWVEREGTGAMAIRFFPAPELEKGKSIPRIEVLVNHMAMAKPFPGYIQELKDFHKRGDTFKDHKLYQEKESRVDGHPGYQVIYEVPLPKEKQAWVQTLVQRSWTTVYSIDLICTWQDLDKLREPYQKVLDSFRFEPLALTDKELQAKNNFTQVLDTMNGVSNDLIMDEWCALLVSGKAYGYRHLQMQAGERDGRKGYTIQSELKENLGQNGVSQIITQGFCSADFSYQILETVEEMNTSDRNRLRNVFNVEINRGQVLARRDVQGQKEEKTFHVDRDVLLRDIAKGARKLVLNSSQKELLIQQLYLSEDEISIELFENAGKEKRKIDDIETDASLVMTLRDRKSRFHVWLDPQKRLLEEITPDSPFKLKATSKEAALKAFEGGK